MEASISKGTGHSRNTQARDWPGERNPDQWDVHDALQVPNSVFKSRFKAALLLSEDAVDCRVILDTITESGPSVQAVQSGLTTV